MVAVAARVLKGARTVFRRRRSAQYRLQPGALHRRARSGADLRIRGLRGPSRTSASVHRRPDPRQWGGLGDFYGRSLWANLQRGLGRDCLARRSADRSPATSTPRSSATTKPRPAYPAAAACDQHQRSTMIMRLKRRAFVDKLDFLTSPAT